MVRRELISSKEGRVVRRKTSAFLLREGEGVEINGITYRVTGWRSGLLYGVELREDESREVLLGLNKDQVVWGLICLTQLNGEETNHWWQE